MTIDWTISIGTLLQVTVFLFGGITLAFTLLFDVRQLKRDVGKLAVQMETLGSVMVDLAKVDGRFDTAETRLTRVEKDIDDLRHGRGYILDVPSHVRPPRS